MPLKHTLWLYPALGCFSLHFWVFFAIIGATHWAIFMGFVRYCVCTCPNDFGQAGFSLAKELVEFERCLNGSMELLCSIVSCVCSSVVERCPDKTEVESSILSTRTILGFQENMKEISQQKGNDTRIALFLFAKISGWIAVPVIFSLFLGRWLDQKFSSGNTFFLALTALSFIVSLVGIVRASKQSMREIEKQAESNKQSS